jgi:hypothetical protein
MSGPEVNARVETSVHLKPILSQTFLVSLLAFPTICSAILFGIDKPSGGWAFFVLALLSTIAAVWSWRSSQPDVDSAGSHPTNLALPDGTLISTDLRTIRDPKALQNFLEVINQTVNRRPLPDADGLVGVDLNLLPDSKEKAQEATRQINDDTQAITNSLIDAFKLSEGDAAVAPVLLEKAGDK